MTTNGGITWVGQTSNVSVYLSAISCPTTQVCRAVGGGGTILATGNGGTTWTVQTSGTTGGLNAITCASPSTCFAVGVGTAIADIPGVTPGVGDGSMSIMYERNW